MPENMEDLWKRKKSLPYFEMLINKVFQTILWKWKRFLFFFQADSIDWKNMMAVHQNSVSNRNEVSQEAFERKIGIRHVTNAD